MNNLNSVVQKGENTDSFVVRENVINGQLNTVQETESKGGIQSMKGMKRGGPNNCKARPSIYQ